MIRRLLIANRGEIAIRIARGARELGISPVGVYSDADERALFRDALDTSLRIGPGPAAESYLRIDAVVAAAKTLGADAVHPGYGFLSERAPFAQAVIDAGLIFVGPTPAAIAAMGSKIEAKRRVREFGVPVVPGYDGDDQQPMRLREEAARIGVPLLVKASAGGGGRGMRVVNDLAEFDAALAAAKREALASFGDDTMLLERYLRDPRHIEFQILGDQYGALIHLGERECSIQRRHQKVVEEAPSPALDPALRAAMGEAALAAARSVEYTNAGTAEFMLDTDGAFYFLEMNARLQVEHPVTELVYGIDLVHEQLHIANGERLRLQQGDLIARGAAIEVRVNAEDPAHGFLPAAGTIARFNVPAAPGVRVDSGVTDGSTIPLDYDSLVAKIIVWGADRDAAVARLAATLDATSIAGVATNLPLLRAIAHDPVFGAGETTTSFLDRRLATYALDTTAPVTDDVKILAAAALLQTGDAWRLAGIGIPIALMIDGGAVHLRADRTASGWMLRGTIDVLMSIEVHGTHYRVSAAERTIEGDVILTPFATVIHAGRSYRIERAAPPSANAEHAQASGGSGSVTAPMPGKIVTVNVANGDVVEARALLVVLEAMKMEHRIEAPIAGIVRDIRVAPGDLVASGATLVTIGE